MWLVAGLLGVLVGYFIWRLRPRNYIALKKQIHKLNARLAELQAGKEQLNIANQKLMDELTDLKAKYAQLLTKMVEVEDRLAQRQEALAAFARAADDLTAIDGINAEIEGLLQNAGIHTFRDLANAQAKVLKYICEEIGGDCRPAEAERWRKHAYRLYTGRKGHYASFAELKIGRKQVENLQKNLEIDPIE